MKIGIVQNQIKPNIEDNINYIRHSINLLASQGAQIICLSELFYAEYFPQFISADVESMAFDRYSSFMKIWQQMAIDNRIVLIVPYYERSSENLFNSVIVYDCDGSIAGHYQKVHIPHDPLYWEQNYFLPGEINYPVIRTQFANIGVLICFDQWFPEPARELAMKGADIIFYPTAIGVISNDKESMKWQDAWITIQRSHAIANNIHVVAVNRTGKEGEIHFWGNSFICDGLGHMLLEMKNKEDNKICEIEISSNRQYRQDWGFFRNLRPDIYSTNNYKYLDNVLNDYHLPAEWEQQEGVWLAWPVLEESFPNCLKQVEQTYIEIIKHLLTEEDVFISIQNENQRQTIIKLLLTQSINLDRVKFYQLKCRDVWFRDYGPIYLVNTKRTSRIMTHWSFNAWGGKYDALIDDHVVPSLIAQMTHEKQYRIPMYLEGGAIETNGNGILLTTKECLVNENRNLYVDINTIEFKLKKYFKINDIVWLNGGIKGDDTDGHIDNLVRFVNSNELVYVMTDNQLDPNYEIYCANEKIILNHPSLKNIKKSILPIPSVFNSKKECLPASYANFFIANKKVLMPIFEDHNDELAIQILMQCFPDKSVIPVNCKYLIQGMGSIHCVTQQVPFIERNHI